MKGSCVIPVLVLTIVSIHSARSIPIPARSDGFIFQTSSSSTPSVFLEAFIDPLCSDSADAWPVLTKVAQYFQNDLLFTVHPFPLPYHHNAFFACRALHIMDNLNNSLTIPLLELFFDAQSNFSTSWTMNETPSSVVNRIVQLVMDSFGETLPSDFESRFQAGFDNSNYDRATRISFKFGCARVVTGTPYFFVNGIPIYDADSSWDFFQWIDIIEPLLTGESKKHFKRQKIDGTLKPQDSQKKNLQRQML